MATRAARKPKYQRIHYTSTDARAGCRDCAYTEPRWFGKNAQAVAARHTDATGHKTWVESMLMITYTTTERPDSGDWKTSAGSDNAAAPE